MPLWAASILTILVVGGILLALIVWMASYANYSPDLGGSDDAGEV
jgi:hypothetical protein